MKRLLLIVASFAVTAVWMSACGDESSRSRPTAREDPVPQRLSVEVSDRDEVFITLPSGQTVSSWEDFAEAAAGEQWDFNALEISADISASAPLSEVGESAQKKLGDVKFGVGKYYVRVSWEQHFIPCFGRVANHLGAMISYKGQSGQIANLHLAAWTDDKRVCFGISESASGFCWKNCTPTWQNIRDGIAQALVAVGVAYVAAQVIASILATLSLAAFAI